MIDLVQHSIHVIRSNQLDSGAYPACPTMPDYQFCWFRDSSFIAHSMLLWGEVESAMRLHTWAAKTIQRYRSGAQRAMDDFRSGKAPNPHDVLRARYTYDGSKGPDDWPEFQLDGLGTWIWALNEVQKAGHALSTEIMDSAAFVADYLCVLWSSPCHDLWEEHGDQVHTYTLAAIEAGLNSAAKLFGSNSYRETATAIDLYIHAHCKGTNLGFIKSVGVNWVDGSLVGLATPYRLTALDSEVTRATIARIETDLHHLGKGVHRFLGDSYYGGGAWLLLEAWLGWYYAETGSRDKAQTILESVMNNHVNGYLPEQVVPPMLTSGADYERWVTIRGPIATPLLWSHAMYLILVKACSES